jgi:hypothetical protein
MSLPKAVCRIRSRRTDCPFAVPVCKVDGTLSTALRVLPQQFAGAQYVEPFHSQKAKGYHPRMVALCLCARDSADACAPTSHLHFRPSHRDTAEGRLPHSASRRQIHSFRSHLLSLARSTLMVNGHSSTAERQTADKRNGHALPMRFRQETGKLSTPKMWSPKKHSEMRYPGGLMESSRKSVFGWYFRRRWPPLSRHRFRPRLPVQLSRAMVACERRCWSRRRDCQRYLRSRRTPVNPPGRGQSP